MVTATAQGRSGTDKKGSGISDVTYSASLHLETELPGKLLPADTIRIISYRYRFAARLARDKRVLEVGSGPGIGMTLLSRYANSVVGAELSVENIRLARQHYGKNQRIVRADAHNLPFSSASFDLVVAMAMVYYLNIDQFLKEVRRILEPGGSLFFCISNKDVPGFVPAPYTTRYYSVPELSAKLSEHGMTGVFQGVFPAPGNLLRRRLRATIKNTAKSIVCSTRGGRALWLRLRGATLGSHAELPLEIVEEPCFVANEAVIQPDKIDRSHRVIYVTARARGGVV
jgi:SAM-dependent methyltransferase